QRADAPLGKQPYGLGQLFVGPEDDHVVSLGFENCFDRHGILLRCRFVDRPLPSFRSQSCSRNAAISRGRRLSGRRIRQKLWRRSKADTKKKPTTKPPIWASQAIWLSSPGT